MWKLSDFILLGSKINADGNCSHIIKRCLLLGRRAMSNLASVLKSKGIILPTMVSIVEALVFPVVMLNVRVGPYRRLSTEELTLLNCGVGENTWEFLGLQGDQTKRNWPWIRRTEAEARILWPPNVKCWCTGKDPDAGKKWRARGEGVTEDEMVGKHHWLNEHEFEQTQRDSDAQRRLICCISWGQEDLDLAYWLNNK